ncbi:MAG: XRE family transcriptional regulator [Bacteroidetes bacterium]|nr:MAG: XRE family transcriptional regulator [Bacteroidota bacterium]TAG87142.1 MAG: XRE family transcriptional regulator [Bacteroidota bacterium]
MELYEKITALRKVKRLTQQDMAEKLNMSDNAYSKIEQGKTQISVERLKKIAKVLDMEKQDIENFEEKMIFNKIENGTNTNFGNGINLSENFEKEREAYKSHISDLQKQITTLEKQIEILSKLLNK